MDDHSSSLLCQENETCLEEGGEELEYQFVGSQHDCGVSEDEHVGILIEREIVLGFKKDETMVIGDWVKRARMEAINWVLKVSPTTHFFLYFPLSFINETALGKSILIFLFFSFLILLFIRQEQHWVFASKRLICQSHTSIDFFSDGPLM